MSTPDRLEALTLGCSDPIEKDRSYPIMALRCVYCGEQHETAALVRECWQRNNSPAPQPHQQQAAKPKLSIVDVPERPAEQRIEEIRPGSSLAASADAFAGPDVLGRSLVLSDESAPLPASWAHAPIWYISAAIVADPTRLESLLVSVRGVVRGRQRAVFVLDPAADLSPGVERNPPYSVGPMFSFATDELSYLVWSNSVDARQSDRVLWPLTDIADGNGWRPSAACESGDVVRADGSPVWLDGGPITAFAPIDGVPVIHGVALEHGSLNAFGDGNSAGELAPDQRAAVTHPGGSARIIAPAGSGKTRVLTERARHLMRVWRLPPSAVSLVAFNKRAQLEMGERTRDLDGLQVRTLNAIALAIVNGSPPFAAQPKRFSTIDEPAVRQMIGELVPFPKKRNTDPVATWIEALTLCRLGLVPPVSVERRYDGDIDGFATMFPKYRELCEQRQAVDFDDQIYRAIEVLLRDPRARATAQRASRMLLVDEFQDLTPAHVLLVRLLAGPQGSVFAVGDDDQTIYGYNGADPGWLIDFAELFPGAGDHPLEVNYRCPGGIVTAADRLLRHNQRRVAKTIRAASVQPDGWSSVIDDETLSSTLNAVQHAVDDGDAPTDIAVLTRVNSLLAPVQVGLAGRGIPVVGGVGREFLNRTSISSALAWLRLSVGQGGMQHDDVAEALRRPSRPLPPRIAEWVAEQRSSAELLRLADRLQTERDAQRVREFAGDIEQLKASAGRGATTVELLIELRDRIGLGGAVATLDTHRRGMNRAAQSDDLTALIQLASLHPDAATFPGWLSEQLSSTRRGEGQVGGVTLATVHRVKGQEWPIVIIHHAGDDQFPHRLAEDLEEERRLFHVGLTRASKWATVVAPPDVTPFLAELTTEPPASPGPQRPGGMQQRTSAGGSAPSQRSGGRSASNVPSAGVSSPKADRPGKGLVYAGVGLVLVDQGLEWRIESVGDDGAVAAHDQATRPFAFGKPVTTAGLRKGALTPPGDLKATQIRADDLLRQVRKVLAAGRPAYVVLDDATTDLVARALPRNLAELADIHGIGPAKLDSYGAAILAAIESALDEQ